MEQLCSTISMDGDTFGLKMRDLADVLAQYLILQAPSNVKLTKLGHSRVKAVRWMLKLNTLLRN